jgi:DNA-binding CsgD family transcriptional regulator
MRVARCDRVTVTLSAIDIDRPPHRHQSTSAPVGSAGDHGEALEALAALADLPHRKRTFLTLKVAGYSYDEIAEQLDASYSTVNRQLVRARRDPRRARRRVTVAPTPIRRLSPRTARKSGPFAFNGLGFCAGQLRPNRVPTQARASATSAGEVRWVEWDPTLSTTQSGLPRRAECRVAGEGTERLRGSIVSAR